MARVAVKGRDGALYIGYRESDGTVLIPDHKMRPPRGSTRTGDIEAHEFDSVVLDGPRTIMVYRPPGYSDKSPWRYPVLYLNDGQNMFDASTSAFGVEWQVDESLEHLIHTRKMEPVIAVAVYNSENRFDEYTPAEDPEHGGGGAERYGMFLTRELKPFIDQMYRTDTERSALVGSSLGGLCALYLGWTYPREFPKIGALSPSLWWAKRELIAEIAHSDRNVKDGPQRIWLDVGTKEGDREALMDARTMHGILKDKGYCDGENMIYREVQGATHSEASWAARIGDVLEFLYPPGQGFFTGDG